MIFFYNNTRFTFDVSGIENIQKFLVFQILSHTVIIWILSIFRLLIILLFKLNFLDVLTNKNPKELKSGEDHAVGPPLSIHRLV